MSRPDIVRRLLVRAHAPSRISVMLDGMLNRALDLTVAVVALLITAPLLMIVAGLVALERRGPVIFAHPRLGREGRTFRVLKFRSMVTNGAEVLRRHLESNPEAAAEWAADHKLRDDPRVTPLGAFLRKSSLDELPQLLNVLRGEMSIVGPRPIVTAEISRYGRFYENYCSVRPGITGIWQVSGRNDVSYRRRVAMDAVYAKRKSVMLDLEIMLATIPAVVVRKGSY